MLTKVFSKRFSSKISNQSVLEHLSSRNLIANKSELHSINEHEFFGASPNMYIGFDPTAGSIHLGNLVGIMTALRFNAFGITPHLLIGGATAKIGDPSGKSSDRPMLSYKEVETNSIEMTENLKDIVDSVISSKQYSSFNFKRTNFGKSTYKIINNQEFYDNLNVIDFLRDVGGSLRMGQLLSRDTIKKRVNSKEGISLTEFMYQSLQGYDFLRLFEDYNVRIQTGGSDQWGNMLAGKELIKKLKNDEVMNLTFPLLLTAGGKKFGKSEGNALFLNESKTPVEKIYQYFINMSDKDLKQCFLQFTFLENDEIEGIINSHSIQPEARKGQAILAESIVDLIFGEAASRKCIAKSKLYSGIPIQNLQLLEDCQKFPLYAEHLNCSISKLCVEYKILQTRTQCKRLIRSGSLTLNDNKITSDSVITTDNLLDGKYLILKAGKKKVNVFEYRENIGERREKSAWQRTFPFLGLFA